MKPAHVVGTALFTPGFGSVRAWLRGERDPAVLEPAADVAGARVKRGTSLLTRMQLEVAAAAGRDAELDLAHVATVFGSTFGEMQIAVLQMDMMREGDGIVSPARFKNSVHNTGAGVFSIATGNRGFTTAVAAGWETVASVLLEAFALLDAGTDAVLAVVADEPLPEPLAPDLRYAALAVGLALSAEPSPKALGTLSRLTLDASAAPPPVPSEVDAGLRDNPVWPGLALLEAIHARRGATIPLNHRGDRVWTVNVQTQ